MPVFRKNGKNILFIHVPKCGGTSIENAFRDSGYVTEYLDRKLGQKSMNHLRTCSPQHMHAAQLEEIFRLDRFDLVFMVVRDPVARFRSEYVYKHRKEKTVSRRGDVVSAWARKQFRAYESNPYVLDNHLRPQHEFWMPAARVYRLEDGIDEMLSDLNRRFEIGVTAGGRALNSKKEAGFSSSEVEMPDELTEFVCDFYRDDFTRFGYTPRQAPVQATVPFADGNVGGPSTLKRLKRKARSVASKIKR
ncbi:sulfotransferase family 2 domain-containing protein [Microbacterium horticulturae]|uniref:Sulfotransferase family 2 domain-containing protein n=1 Tax=Microbacterium horticulturae TaxID=3028316 RepID=A0ABY8BWK8_9MICO|nr:sulfotransferase family 2 domain-containing protein [Microbacterium sp. KACC 23027]WEG07907.1 sulfotransferase family 2 domain-containing protein [Microbacterium sp. KACC 23027]